MSVWILFAVSENDGGYLPDSRSVISVHDTREGAEAAKAAETWCDSTDIEEHEVIS